MGALLALAVLLSGCASVTRVAPPQEVAQARWQGRMAIKVFSTPIKAFAADFVLAGSPQQGELTLLTPFGTVLAQLQWSAGAARLETADGKKIVNSEGLDSLVLQTTGAALPIAALFAWLQGNHATADGWAVELENPASGHLVARQTVKEPHTELKILLER